MDDHDAIVEFADGFFGGIALGTEPAGIERDADDVLVALPSLVRMSPGVFSG
jgi:hypothetical protein